MRNSLRVPTVVLVCATRFYAAAIPNALTDLLRGKTPEQAYDTLQQNDCLASGEKKTVRV